MASGGVIRVADSRLLRHRVQGLLRHRVQGQDLVVSAWLVVVSAVVGDAVPTGLRIPYFPASLPQYRIRGQGQGWGPLFSHKTDSHTELSPP